MLSRRFVFGALASASALAVTRVSIAKGNHYHKNGHDLLGEKLKINGKHAVGKAGKETVIAEVNGGKVLDMRAGNLPVQKVMTKNKMAFSTFGEVQLASYKGVQLAQIATIYYGYCFDDGFDLYYYWFPAYDVYSTDGWIEYVPV